MQAKSAFFTNQKAGQVKNTNAIVPLISNDPRTDEIIFIGTAFYI